MMLFGRLPVEAKTRVSGWKPPNSGVLPKLLACWE